jgi:predicted ATP-grasp superfamily ATP-dependent carboligase
MIHPHTARAPRLKLMNEFKNPAIVFGGGATTGLGAVRSLGRAGVPVYYLDEKKSETVCSRYCRKSFIIPQMGDNKEELKKVLLKLKRQTTDTAVLFPATDSFALNLSDLVDEIGGYYLPAPPREVIETLIEKKRFYQSLTKGKVPHPTTYFLESFEDTQKILTLISYPIFIKPSISYSFFQRFHKKGFVANSKEELLQYLRFMDKEHIDVMAQEIVPGPPTSHIFVDGYVDSRTNPKALFARRRLRMWPLSFGNSTATVSIPVSEISHIKDMLFAYLKSINYRGLFSAEFKRDERSGVLKLLEINSRTSAWFNTLSAKCGINLMLIAYLDAIGKDTRYSEDYEIGMRWISFKDDTMSSMKMLMDGNLTIHEWMSSLRGKKDFLTYAKDDLRPFIMSFTHIISEMARAT